MRRYVVVITLMGALLSSYAYARQYEKSNYSMANLSLRGLSTCREISKIYEDVSNSGMPVGRMGILYFAECSLMPQHEKQKWLANAQLFKSNLTPAAPVSMRQS